MASEPTPATLKRAQRNAAYVTWLFFGNIGMGVLTLAAVYAPARIKLLGLFSIVFGAIAGFGLGWFARSLGMPRTIVLTAIAAVLIAVGLVGVTVESHRLWSDAEWEAYEKSPAGRLAVKELKNEQIPEDFKTGLQESIDRQRDELRFQSYLARRVSSLGNVRTPWPLVLWLLETALATAAGMWAFFTQMSKRLDSTPELSHPLNVES